MSNFRPNVAHVVLSEFLTNREVTVVIEDPNRNVIDVVSGDRLRTVHVANNDILKISANPPFRTGDTICNVHEVVSGKPSSTIKTTVSANDARGTHVKKFTITGDSQNSTHVGHATL